MMADLVTNISLKQLSDVRFRRHWLTAQMLLSAQHNCTFGGDYFENKFEIFCYFRRFNFCWTYWWVRDRLIILTRFHGRHGGMSGGSMDMQAMCEKHKGMMAGKSTAEQQTMMNEHMKSMSPEMRIRMQAMYAKYTTS
jgi:hypothetical protein